jgi:hypothetical protein
MQRITLVAGAALLTACSAEIPNFDDDPAPEVCGGSVCFAPEHLAVRRWGDGEFTVAAWRGTNGCELPRSGTSSRTPIPGLAIVAEVHGAHAGARVPVIPHDRAEEWEGPYAIARSVRVDPETGRALADEEAVMGEVTLLDYEPANGNLRMRIRARWSSGVSGEQLIDVAGWPGCTTPVNTND